MYLLVSKFRFLEFQFPLSRVAPCLQFVTTNCLFFLVFLLMFVYYSFCTEERWADGLDWNIYIFEIFLWLWITSFPCISSNWQDLCRLRGEGDLCRGLMHIAELLEKTHRYLNWRYFATITGFFIKRPDNVYLEQQANLISAFGSTII
jgi:hypothetical protein